MISIKRSNEIVLSSDFEAIEHETNEHQKTNEHVEDFMKLNSNIDSDYDTIFDEKITENMNMI